MMLGGGAPILLHYRVRMMPTDWTLKLARRLPGTGVPHFSVATLYRGTCVFQSKTDTILKRHYIEVSVKIRFISHTVHVSQ